MLLSIIYGVEMVYWAAFALCFLGVLCRDWTAIALFLANGCAWLIDLFGIPFETWAWVSLDVFTAWMIMRPGIGKREVVILALFLPCWAAYLLEEPWRYMAATMCVTVQMFIVTPGYRTVIERARRVDPNEIFDDFFKVRGGE